MSEVITGVLKFTFGLISNKLRTYGAEKLQDGGLTDQKFRGWIVRELDDIKSKLDAISRKDLCASISFLQQGVQRLNMSLGESELSSPGASSTNTKPAQPSGSVEDAVALANAIGKLRIDSHELFDLAKESFKEAGKEATVAFHNAALSTKERVLASKVRIASGILEHLERTEVAANDCLHYLQELHNMPAIQEIFSVHIHGGIKSLFKKTSRADIVETVTMINLILADFISTFTKRRMAVFDWPLIECGKRVVHPIHCKRVCVQKMTEMEITPPWDIVRYKDAGTKVLSSAINSKRDIIGVFSGDSHPRKLDRATGEWRPFCLSSSDHEIGNSASVAIDDDDTVYVVSCRHNAGNLEATLSVYSSNGKIIHHCTLDFIKTDLSTLFRHITVTRDKKIVFCSGHEHSNRTVYVYVCDMNGKLIDSFPIVTQYKDGTVDAREDVREDVTGIFVSCDKLNGNEITVATHARHWHVGRGIVTILIEDRLCVYTQRGKFKRLSTIDPPQPTADYNISFDNLTKNYIVYTQDSEEKIKILKYVSETGELQYSLSLHDKNILDYDNLISHTSGTVAFVDSKRVLYFQ